jgi:hypothetical protein
VALQVQTPNKGRQVQGSSPPGLKCVSGRPNAQCQLYRAEAYTGVCSDPPAGGGASATPDPVSLEQGHTNASARKYISCNAPRQATADDDHVDRLGSLMPWIRRNS